MALPTQVLADVPPGLQYLSTIDQLLVQQKSEIFKVYNRYTIKNIQGQTVYFAVEENECCSCRPPMSSLNIVDNDENELIQLRRQQTCKTINCFPCCCAALEKMEVYAPPGNLVGTIEQTWDWFTIGFNVKNENDEIVLKIERTTSLWSCGGEDIEFKVYSADKSAEVGKILKQWTGLRQELFTTADHFGISFPLDLDLRMKTVLLGACFLIDHMYFEGKH